MDHKAVKQWAVIPAAGIGARMQNAIPKQYLPLLDKTVIEHTLSILLSYAPIDAIVVAIAENDSYWSTLSIANHPKIIKVLGGETRAHSVYNALDTLIHEGPSWVCVHDAVRPCLSHGELDLLFAAKSYSPQGAILALPSQNTLKLTSDQRTIKQTLNRDQVWQALTPQLFNTQDLHHAIQHCLSHDLAITDESSAMEHLGHHPYIVPGKASNIKITTPEDLNYAEFLLHHDSTTV